MAKITLTAITWDDPQPDSYKPVSVAYRNSLLPDIPSNYTIVSTGAYVDTTGVFLIPVVIDNLDITQNYVVRVISLCGGFTAYREFTQQTPAAFSTGFSLGFNS